MTPSRWQRIEELHQAALKLEPAERRAFLSAADPELCREVEALLALTNPTEDATLTIVGVGAQFGPYKIEASIGKGGMGEVFCAVDTRLGRKVAIKTSNKPFDPRFEREARAIAQLNHPHICTLHDVGPNYLVMELVEGETLAARIKKGKLSVEQAAFYGAQIADALAAAHAKGITHRDLKPGNVMVTKSGVKVLDFGLAKVAGDEALTRANAVMGTPAYMAPEQREGKDCDARTDIYALGLVLREMACGNRNGEASLPAQFAHVISSCLEEDPAERWQTASDVKKVLKWCAIAQLPVTPAPAASSRVPWIVALAATAAFLTVTAVALLQREAPREFGPSQFEISLAEADSSMPVISPDGRMFVFETQNQGGPGPLHLRSLDSVESRVLPETQGATNPVWSPDGKWIAFWSGGKLKKIGLAGGAPLILAEIPLFQDPAWSPNGSIIFRTSNRTPLFRISDSGGSVQPLTKLNAALTENSHRSPQFLTDGRHFLFVSRCGERANNALYLASLDSPEVKRLMPAQAQVRFVPAHERHPDLLFFYRDGALVAQQFDAATGVFSGEPKTVVEKVAYVAPSIQAGFNVSRDGRMVMVRNPGAGESRFVWYLRNGQEAGTLGPRGDYMQPRLSPHQDYVLFSQPDPQTGNRDVFYMEVARGITTRLTTNVANDWNASWAPDGTRVLFGSDRDGGTALPPYVKASLDPASAETRVPGFQGDLSDWSADGRWIAGGSGDIHAGSPVPGGPIFTFIATPAAESDVRFSPDGRWLAYNSNESGRYNIYVRPFAGATAQPEGKIQISPDGGEYAAWGPGGDELFYMTADRSIVSVDTSKLGQTHSVPSPVRLFQACPETRPQGLPNTNQPYLWTFDTRDGKRFLVNCLADPPGRYTVLLNWAFPR